MTQPVNTPATDDLVNRIFAAGLATGELANIYIGDRLGLYKQLAAGDRLTPAELAGQLGLAERYVREWLEQQAVANVLAVDDASLPEAERRYWLPPAHVSVLVDLDSLNSMTPLARFFVAAMQTLPQIMDAFRFGGGVGWSAFGPDMVESQGDFNRPWLVNQLASEYLPAVPELHERLLSSEPPARVLDMACGLGWAAIAIARGYPHVHVDAIDPDSKSIELARQAVADMPEIEPRVRFEALDGSKLQGREPYDMAIIVESLHDMAQPVEVLSSVRRVLAPAGALLVVDERVADRFTAPGDEVERLMYAFSVLCCLPSGLAERPSAGTGTVMRAGTLRRYASEAGFTSVDVLDLEHPLLRFYLLKP